MFTLVTYCLIKVEDTLARNHLSQYISGNSIKKAMLYMITSINEYFCNSDCLSWSVHRTCPVEFSLRRCR